jgi:hypothetical protein
MMKSNSMNTSRDSLAEVLRRWRVAPPAEPGFRSNVWRRIGRQSRATWSVYLRPHATAWALAAVVTVSAAAYTGHLTARAQVRADREALVVNYLVELDPRVQAVLKAPAP